MDKRKTERVGLLLISFSFLLYAGSGYGILRGSMEFQPPRAWEGYYPVLLPAGDAGTKLGNIIASAFPVISYESSSVRYFNFSGLEELPLAEVESRFSPIDSRIDPYMRQAGGYFVSRDGNFTIIYCQSDENPVKVLLQLRRLLKNAPAGWVFIGTNWTVRLVLTGFFLLLTAGAFFIPRRRGIVVLLFGLPWLPLVFFGPIQTVMIASAVFYAAVLTGTYLPTVVREYLNRGKCMTAKPLFYLTAVLWAVGLFFGICILRVTPAAASGVISIAYGVCAALAVEIFLVGLAAVKHAGQVHTLFFHIPLAKSKKMKLRLLRLLPVMVMMALVIAIPPFVSRSSAEADTEIPRPGEIHSGPPDYTLLSMLDAEAAAADGDLPGIGDYLKHRLYQGGWLYNVPYEIPKPGTSYSISTFSPAEEGDGGAGIAQEMKTVLRITEDWYEREISGGRGTGIIDLLLRQQGWTRVRYEKTTQVSFTKMEIIVYYIAWFALQAAGLFSFTYLTPITLYGNKAVELRRQRQAA
jgi:hypothetical protein